MESFLYYNCIVVSKTAEPDVGLKPDSHIKDIVLDMSKSGKANQPIKATKVHQDMRLNFVGKVTRFPSSDSLFLTQAFGQHFYVAAGLACKLAIH